MKAIWKFPLKITDSQFVEMPEDAEILSADNQNGVLCIWALGTPSLPKKVRHIEIFGTGNPVSLNHFGKKFIGTVQMGHFVWHVFELQ